MSPDSFNNISKIIRLHSDGPLGGDVIYMEHGGVQF